MIKTSVILFFLLFTFSFSSVILEKEPIQPIKLPTDLDINKVLLGEKLFFDARLSKDNTISCFTCHNIDAGGADNLEIAIGIEGRVGSFNTPTVYNSSLNFVQFWDGRVDNLYKQVDFPIHNENEMSTNWVEIVNKLKDDVLYKDMFIKAFDSEISVQNIKNAIVEYEKSLITPSRFDKYLNGNDNILTKEEIEGYQLFKDYGCSACHQGKNVGGNIYEKLGVFEPYPHVVNEKVFGRFIYTLNDEDKFEYKVPSLRNIYLTAPYLHDGSIKTLDEVIGVMARYQLGKKIQEEDVKKIKAFLKSLTFEKLEKSIDGNNF